MLKSTHKPATDTALLPEGWTAHKAPTGHTYYYNASTKQSTYTRPGAVSALKPPLGPPADQAETVSLVDIPRLGFSGSDPSRIPGLGWIQSSQQSPADAKPREGRRAEPTDRPKSKQAIPGAEPWLLVRTKFGRRFVYDPDKNESFWKFPPEVLKCVVELDRKQRERKERRERGEPSDSELEEDDSPKADRKAQGAFDDGDDYEEIEVTDDEEENEIDSKRPRLWNEEKPGGPVEFNEDDIAYQLASMDQDGELDDLGSAQGGWAGGEEEALAPEDARALFCDMLEDFHINPYSPWETLIEESKMIDDDRYLCLPTMRSRKETWEAWSHRRIQSLKEERARQEKTDPRIPYLAFLQKHATLKLYWPEFKRKFRKEPEMRDTKLTDKDREKWFREHITRLKLPESTLKTDLKSLLKSLSSHALNRSSSLNSLPSEILTDIRYISLRPAVRDPLIEAYIAIQPPAPDANEVSTEEDREVAKHREERERREKAFREREKRVESERRQRDMALRASRSAMKASEEEIQRGLQVDKSGLLRHLAKEEERKAVS